MKALDPVRLLQDRFPAWIQTRREVKSKCDLKDLTAWIVWIAPQCQPQYRRAGTARALVYSIAYMVTRTILGVNSKERDQWVVDTECSIKKRTGSEAGVRFIQPRGCNTRLLLSDGGAKAQERNGRSRG
mmetsp:Transcript_45936/g.71968  ORF Transcript_45936/g.71968 Transcript_45936/m.71968 type:complete len:129 (+) Transcript_45936:107-493(+)